MSERNKAPFQSVDELLRVKGIGPKTFPGSGSLWRSSHDAPFLGRTGL
ncbi:helix-hairpin-helix domain-containing protein [Acidaminococcus intestini]|nr:helix-hairpin-helix domain-containing protein [Acidaminococcus intestini]